MIPVGNLEEVMVTEVQKLTPEDIGELHERLAAA